MAGNFEFINLLNILLMKQFNCRKEAHHES